MNQIKPTKIFAFDCIKINILLIDLLNSNVNQKDIKKNFINNINGEYFKTNILYYFKDEIVLEEIKKISSTIKKSNLLSIDIYHNKLANFQIFFFALIEKLIETLDVQNNEYYQLLTLVYNLFFLTLIFNDMVYLQKFFVNNKIICQKKIILIIKSLDFLTKSENTENLCKKLYQELLDLIIFKENISIKKQEDFRNLFERISLMSQSFEKEISTKLEFF